MEDDFVYTGPELEIEYISGAGPDFVVFIQGLGNKAQIHNINGHARWIVTRDDGSKYICRPEEARPNGWDGTCIITKGCKIKGLHEKCEV